MVDYPVAVDPASVAILAECVADGRSEIGAQLHAALVERCRRSSGADQSNSSSTSTNTRK
jgi:hypothetical protein